MILSSLPDLPPRPETNANAAFRRRFYERWGREHAVVLGTTRRAEFLNFTQTLSIKMAWHGGERYRLRHRQVRVDDDNYLILNEGATYASDIRADTAGARHPVGSMSVFFAPGFAQAVAAQRAQPAWRALDDPAPAVFSCGFFEHLRRHDRVVSPVLARIRQGVIEGERDNLWLEQILLALLDAMLASETREHGAQERLTRLRPSTRAELARRLRLASDFIESEHHKPITLEQMAQVASLSPWHFSRYFAQLHGLSPHRFLIARRVRTARRLMQAGPAASADRETIALLSGFGSRWALQRALSQHPASQPAFAQEMHPQIR